MNRILPVTMLSLAVLAGCGGASAPAAEPAPATSSAAPAASAGTASQVATPTPAEGDGEGQAVARASTEPPAPSAPAAAGTPIGVPECDEYIGRMRACLQRLDPSAKGATEKSFQQTEDAWRAAADLGGAARDALSQGCRAAVDAIPALCR